jgi:hypothetical protein
MQPGAWATEGTPQVPGYVAAEGESRTSMKGIGRSIRAQVDAAGEAYGCHSCGRKSAEIRADEAANGRNWNGHFIPDHQPPKSAVKAADKANRSPIPGEVRLYPHCPRCARTQGGQCGAETRASNRCSDANTARIDNAVVVMGQNAPT